MVDVDGAGLDQLQKSLAPTGVSLVAYPHSVADDDAVAATTADVGQRLGGLDILVNAAGIGHTQDVKVADTPIEIFDLVMNVNLRGAFLFCRAARRSGGRRPRSGGR
jgi:NAD(P)-dependent dehydrogenase (short-subunit alcohol dehydrogenase family)